MPIFRCENCSYTKKVPRKAIGRKAECPKCGTRSVIVDSEPEKELTPSLDDSAPESVPTETEKEGDGESPQPAQAEELKDWGKVAGWIFGWTIIAVVLAIINTEITMYLSLLFAVVALLGLTEKETQDKLLKGLKIERRDRGYTVFGGTALVMLISGLFQFGFAPPSTSQSYPYQYVSSKTEYKGFENVMELYAYSGPIDASNLKAFCREKKAGCSNEGFYYVVIFDSAANAEFPSNPFTAQYGGEWEKLKHIRAIYGYNPMNSFSILTIHDGGGTHQI